MDMIIEFINEYTWYIVGGVVLVFGIIGFFVSKKDKKEEGVVSETNEETAKEAPVMEEVPVGEPMAEETPAVSLVDVEPLMEEVTPEPVVETPAPEPLMEEVPAAELVVEKPVFDAPTEAPAEEPVFEQATETEALADATVQDISDDISNELPKPDIDELLKKTREDMNSDVPTDQNLNG